MGRSRKWWKSLARQARHGKLAARATSGIPPGESTKNISATKLIALREIRSQNFVCSPAPELKLIYNENISLALRLLLVWLGEEWELWDKVFYIYSIFIIFDQTRSEKFSPLLLPRRASSTRVRVAGEERRRMWMAQVTRHKIFIKSCAKFNYFTFICSAGIPWKANDSGKASRLRLWVPPWVPSLVLFLSMNILLWASVCGIFGFTIPKPIFG